MQFSKVHQRLQIKGVGNWVSGRGLLEQNPADMRLKRRGAAVLLHGNGGGDVSIS